MTSSAAVLTIDHLKVDYLYAPKEAAATNAWARLRIADGHPEPYNITWFEIG